MKIPRLLTLLGLLVASCLTVVAEAPLHDAALPQLGATAQGSKARFNKDWPASKTLDPTQRMVGAIFGPFEGATIDIRLVMPLDIKAVDITAFNYRNNRTANGVTIFIDERQIAESDLPDEPGKVTRIPAEGHGQNVRLVFKGGHPARPDPKTGKTGPNWGGIGKIAVLSPINLSGELAPVENYSVPVSPDFIALTNQSNATPDATVHGAPRQAQGHPRTLWDKEDVRHFRGLIQTNPEFARQYQALKRGLDERLSLPVSVPAPEKNDKGEWIHVSDRVHGRTHNDLSLLISNLGTVYALSGEEKYADYAKRQLLAYADVFDKYAPGNRPGFNHDQGKVFDQRLSDATWLIPVARGYDLIHVSPGITPDERRRIEDDLLKASARFIAANSSVLRAPTNWSAICTTAVLIVGYATDDDELVRLAMYGPRGTKENPAGGVMLHFSEKTINTDGLWAEGAIGYQFMAMQALVANAEILWRNGIDMYRHRDGAMKKLFDSAIAYAYPDLKTPSVHDSGSTYIVGRESYLYEYAYLRYRDPRYLLILDHPEVATRLDTRFQQFPVSVLYERETSKSAPPVEWVSENFNDVGFGILRNTTANGTASLLLDYGPNRSHGHPDKMNIDLWTSATGRLIPDPGMVWYEQPLYRNWYYNSVAHNTLVVDEQNQLHSDGALLVYGFGDTQAMQRAHALHASPGVIMDRAVFLTPGYVADLFGAFARLPRKFDLAWHVRGTFSADLPLKPATLPEPREPGYSELADVTSAQAAGPWRAAFDVGGAPVRFIAADTAGTEVITGDGWYGRERPRTILQRRQTNQTVYGNVIDISNAAEPFVKSAALDGSLADGRALLTVRTAVGEDLAFASYRPGTYKVGELETDALQAFVRRDGSGVVGLFLGGGKTLKIAGATLALDEPGLVSLERADTGAYVLANHSTRPAQVALDFAPVKGREAWRIDAAGKRLGPADPLPARIALEPGARLEFATRGQSGIYEARAAMLRLRQQEQEAALKAERDAAAERSATRDRAAKASPVPAGTLVVVQAETFTGESGGKVGVATNKVGHVGTSIAGWNGEGHWLEWAVELPAEGYYNLSLVYCTEPNNSMREIVVNGEIQEPYAPFVLPATGGYSNGTDDWRLFTATDPIGPKPLLVKFRKGKNTLRLVNANGLAANLDYLVVSSPDVTPTRENTARTSP